MMWHFLWAERIWGAQDGVWGGRKTCTHEWHKECAEDGYVYERCWLCEAVK